MTKEKLSEIIEKWTSTNRGLVADRERLADRIQAAYDDEKRGEVVVWEGVAKFKADTHVYYGPELDGKKGRLIFRPDGE